MQIVWLHHKKGCAGYERNLDERMSNIIKLFAIKESKVEGFTPAVKNVDVSELEKANN